MKVDPNELVKDGWHTPNTYDVHFQTPPEKSGVYFLILPIMENIKIIEHNILYIGSAKNLKTRYDKHEVRRFLIETYGYIQFYFKEEDEYRKIEKDLINKIQPKYNKQWR